MPGKVKEAARKRAERAEKKRIGETSARERELERSLQSLSRLLAWQSRTIEGLQKQVVGLRALLVLRPFGADAEDVYRQSPSTKVIKEAAWTPLERTEATEQRIMALEAEMTLLRAAMNSGVGEEREEP